MSISTTYKLETNPFRITPATSPNELIWAGFTEIREKFELRIKRSIKIQNSSLILNWGEYGSGKTHAARYFNKASVLEEIAKDVNSEIPYSIVLPLPKGKEPVFSMYTSVIDKLDIQVLRSRFQEKGASINSFIDEMHDNMQIQSILKAIFNPDVYDINLLKKYLYGNISNTELKGLNDFGILRHLNSDSDYTKLLAGLFSCLTYDKKVYSAVIIWIDEFEDLAVLSSSNIDKTNNFLREILDNTPNNLLVFLNLTQSALFGVEDLGEYVYESVRSRIKDRVNFDLPSPEQFRTYLKDLLEKFRSEEVEEQIFFPYEKDLVDELIRELGNVSLRSFNEAFSMLLELAELESVCPITSEFFERNRNEVLGWKE
ncbi:MAG: hypothetical protein RIC35_05470 [Marinoscillum sp.]